MPSSPIYILSKDRADTCLTADILLSEKISFKLVVEPQDVDKYLKKYPKELLVIMPENNRGIAYVRNFCKSHSIGNKYHWQIDDNIKSFRVRENNKNVKTTAGQCLNAVEARVFKYKNIGISGLRHTCFAFAQKKEISLNQQVYSCVLVNNELPIKWRDGLVEDTDYSLQVLNTGFCTMMFNRLLIDKAVTMTMTGGNTEVSYSGNGRLMRSIGLCRAWPNAFEITNQYGRVKIKPSRIWHQFRQVPILI